MSIMKLLRLGVVAAIIVAGMEVRAMGETLEAGAASAVVNPAMGSFIAGDAQNRRFEGHHDDLFVKAAALRSEDESVVLVTVDCIGLTYPDVIAIRNGAKAAEACPNPGRIVVSSTHIHNGPDVVGLWGPDYTQSGRDEAYMKTLIDAAVDTISRAWKSLTPVEARWGLTNHGEEWVENICEPDQLDRSLTVIQFTDQNGHSVATLTNFACHPTILDGVHDIVSADWVGGYYRAMAKRFGGEHLFMQGAIGAWIQPDKGDRSFELADRYGQGVADAAAKALGEGRPLSGDGIAYERTLVSFPPENEGWAALTESGLIDRDMKNGVATEIAWFRIGDAQFATHPGETPPAYSHKTKSWMTSEPKFVIGLGLDALGYVLPPAWFESPDEYKHAEYLIATSVGPQTGPILLKTLEGLIGGSQ